MKHEFSERAMSSVIVLVSIAALSVAAVGLYRLSRFYFLNSERFAGLADGGVEIWKQMLSAARNIKNHQSGTKVVILDEQSRINLNGLDIGNIRILKEFLKMNGVHESSIEAAAYAILDWKDADNELSDLEYGDEGSEERRVKNAFFQSMEELTLIKSVTPKIFELMRDQFTVFPVNGVLKINMRTASEMVLQSTARSLSGEATNTNESDADSLVDKILDQRRNLKIQTLNWEELNLNKREQVIAIRLRSMHADISDHWRIKTLFVDEKTKMSQTFEAVIDRNDMRVEFFRRMSN